MLTRKSVRTGISKTKARQQQPLSDAKAEISDQDHAPVTVTSRGGNILSFYFTRSFKRRKRAGHEARQAAYKKGDLSTRREPDFGLTSVPPSRAARPAAFSQALRQLRED